MVQTANNMSEIHALLAEQGLVAYGGYGPGRVPEGQKRRYSVLPKSGEGKNRIMMVVHGKTIRFRIFNN